MNIEELKQIVKDSKLGEDRYWKNLLHYEKGFFFEESVIDDESYFFSPLGKRNPEAELLATLESFAQGDYQDSAHPINLFPARLLWILEKIPTSMFEPELWNNGEVIFVGGWQSQEDQIDILLDLILEENGYEKYYKEILDKMITES